MNKGEKIKTKSNKGEAGCDFLTSFNLARKVGIKYFVLGLKGGIFQKGRGFFTLTQIFLKKTKILKCFPISLILNTLFSIPSNIFSRILPIDFVMTTYLKTGLFEGFCY